MGVRHRRGGGHRHRQRQGSFAREDRRRAVPQRPGDGPDGTVYVSDSAALKIYRGAERQGVGRSSRAATWSSSRTACWWTAAPVDPRHGSARRRSRAQAPGPRTRRGPAAQRASLRVRPAHRGADDPDPEAGRRHRRDRAGRQRRAAGHGRHRPATAPGGAVGRRAGAGEVLGRRRRLRLRRRPAHSRWCRSCSRIRVAAYDLHGGAEVSRAAGSGRGRAKSRRLELVTSTTTDHT